MGKAIPKGSAVYIRYLDHVLYKNTPKPITEPDERETLGWLAREAGDWIYIHHDVPIECPGRSSGSGKGMLLRSSILEIRPVYKKGERVETGSTIHH